MDRPEMDPLLCDSDGFLALSLAEFTDLNADSLDQNPEWESTNAATSASIDSTPELASISTSELDLPEFASSPTSASTSGFASTSTSMGLKLPVRPSSPMPSPPSSSILDSPIPDDAISLYNDFYCANISSWLDSETSSNNNLQSSAQPEPQSASWLNCENECFSDVLSDSTADSSPIQDNKHSKISLGDFGLEMNLESFDSLLSSSEQDIFDFSESMLASDDITELLPSTSPSPAITASTTTKNSSDSGCESGESCTPPIHHTIEYEHSYHKQLPYFPESTAFQDMASPSFSCDSSSAESSDDTPGQVYIKLKRDVTRRCNVQSENVPPRNARVNKRRIAAANKKGKKRQKPNDVEESRRHNRRQSNAPILVEPGSDESNPNKTRDNHNTMERERRKAQRIALNTLRGLLPQLSQDEKAPKVRILDISAAYIQSLDSEFQCANDRRGALFDRNKKLHQRLQQILSAMYN